MTDRRLAIIGAALDLGAGRRGVDMGPSAIRYAGLDERLVGLGLACADWGNVETAFSGSMPTAISTHPRRLRAATSTGCRSRWRSGSRTRRSAAPLGRCRRLR